MKIAKYFWDLNEKAIKELELIFKNPFHPKYVSRMFTLLSRLDEPKKLFSIIKKEHFIETWPRIRRYWKKLRQSPDFLTWWDTIYKHLLEKRGIKQKFQGGPPQTFLQIGNIIKKVRISKGLSQFQLAQQVGMKQPHVSALEKGEKNVTLAVLIRICKTLGIKKILI